jgi:hypothetical protein
VLRALLETVGERMVDLGGVLHVIQSLNDVKCVDTNGYLIDLEHTWIRHEMNALVLKSWHLERRLRIHNIMVNIVERRHHNELRCARQTLSNRVNKILKNFFKGLFNEISRDETVFRGNERSRLQCKKS